MITCPVCSTPNEDFAPVCVSCGGFLQSRVDALNLFETAWGLIESPRRTFRRIVLARHKNYVHVLSAFFGIALVYGALWYRSAGDRIGSPAMLLLAGPVAGPPVGMLLVSLFAFLSTVLSRVLGGRAGYRIMHAVTAYATVPVVTSLVLVFPAQLAVFGMDLFSVNPHPMVISPIAYLVLLGLDAVAMVWAWILLLEGAVIAQGFARGRAVLLVALLVLVSAGCVGLVSLV
jgi:hypothetical protein